MRRCAPRGTLGRVRCAEELRTAPAGVSPATPPAPAGGFVAERHMCWAPPAASPCPTTCPRCPTLSPFPSASPGRALHRSHRSSLPGIRPLAVKGLYPSCHRSDTWWRTSRGKQLTAAAAQPGAHRARQHAPSAPGQPPRPHLQPGTSTRDAVW